MTILDTTPKPSKPIYSDDQIRLILESCFVRDFFSDGLLLGVSEVYEAFHQVRDKYESALNKVIDYSIRVDEELQEAKRQIPHYVTPRGAYLTFHDAARAVEAEFGRTWGKGEDGGTT